MDGRMKSTELRKLIRSMVRECVNELLAEKYIEHSIHEISGTKKKPTLQETVMPETVPASACLPPAVTSKLLPKQKPTITRDELIRRYNLTQDEPMMEIFQDTATTNPALNGEEIDPPGTITEGMMEKSGIMTKDWTKYF
jgi:hypothetical protein